MMFTGIMDAVHFADILDVPFLSEQFSDGSGHRFQMDNNPKHQSNYIENYFEKNDGQLHQKAPILTP